MSTSSLWNHISPERFRERADTGRRNADDAFVAVARTAGPIIDLPGTAVIPRFIQWSRVRRGAHVMVERDPRAARMMEPDVAALNAAFPAEAPVHLVRGDFFDTLLSWHGVPFTHVLYCGTITLASQFAKENLVENLGRMARSPNVSPDGFHFMITAARRDDPVGRDVLLNRISEIIRKHGWFGERVMLIEYGGRVKNTTPMLTAFYWFHRRVDKGPGKPREEPEEHGEQAWDRDALKVMGWVDAKGFGLFSARQAFEGLKGTFRRMERLRVALRLLVDEGRLRMAYMPERRGLPGRKPSPMYEVV